LPYLDRAIAGNDLILQIITPQATLRQILQQVLVHHLKVAGQDAASVNVAGVRLERLIISEDLRSGRSGHRRQQQTVPDAVSHHLLAQRGPVPSAGRCHAPHVLLEDALAGWRARERLVRSVDLCQLTALLQRPVVNGLEDVLVELDSLLRIKRIPVTSEKSDESIVSIIMKRIDSMYESSILDLSTQLNR
jgi:hypothetical protein